MPSYPINTMSVIEGQIVSTHNGQRIRTILHWLYTGSATIPDGRLLLDGLAAELNGPGDLIASYSAVVNAEVVIQQLRLQWIYPVRYAFEAYDPTGIGPRPAVPAMPSNVAICINRRNFIAGRHNHQDTHLPGVTVDWVANNVLVPLHIGDYNPLMDALKKTYTITGQGPFLPVLLNRAAPATSAPVTECLLYTDTRTMRRRTLFRGE